MKIHLLIGGEEAGPYTKSEVFALLKEGKITTETQGRWENESDWKEVSAVLASGNIGFFSAEQIAKQQEELPEAPIIIPDLAPVRSEAPASALPRKRTPFVLAGVAVLLALCSAGLLVYTFQPPENPSTGSNNGGLRSTIARASTPPQIQSPKQTVAKTDEASPNPPQAYQVADSHPASSSTVSPTPEAAIEQSLQSIPQEGSQSTTAESGTSSPSNQSPAPAGFKESITEIPLPKIPGVGGESMCIARLCPEPQGVLLLCLDRNQHPKGAVQNKEWSDFARNHEFALAAAMFDYSNPDGNPHDFVHISESVQKAIQQGLGSAGLGDVPLFIYGQGFGGTVASSFAATKVPKVSAWASFTNDPQTIQLEHDQRPGLIVCDYEDSKSRPALKSFFEDGRTHGKPWTWLSLATPLEGRSAKAAEFVRSYFEAVLDQKDSEGCWAETDDLSESCASYAMGFPKITAWFPSAKVASMWRTLMPTPHQAADPIIIRKSVRTYWKRQPFLEMFLRLPPGSSKDHPPDGTIAFCTWDWQSDRILAKLRYRPDLKSLAAGGPVWEANNIIKYADEHNLAVLTWAVVQAWSLTGNSDELKPSERRDFEINFDKLCAAWEAGVKLLHDGNQMPDKDMLLYGLSRGAEWAHRLALRKPEHFLAVHVHISSAYDTPTLAANSVLWLLTTGELERGYERAIHFYAACRKLKYPILFKAFIGIGHQDTPLAWDLDHAFFDYALSLKEARDKIIKDHALNMLSTAPISQSWLTSFYNPPYLGDLLNQEVFPISQGDMIPPSLQVSLPTQRIVDMWSADIPKEQSASR